jgi:hypothetical protein
LKRFGPPLLAILLAASVSPLSARAECSKETRQVLNVALTSYTQWQNYSVSSTPAEHGLAAPEWESFEHEMDWIIDNGDMARCSRSTQLLYYSFAASRDAARMTRLYAPLVAIAGSSETVLASLANVVRAALDVYYDDVRRLYYMGYARKNPAEYAHFKRDLGGWFTTTSGTFTPWEKTPPPAAKAAPRNCSERDQPAKVVNQVEPVFPDPAKIVSLGKTSIGVTVTVGPSGNLIDARVTDTSFNAAVDNAALGGALQSTYAPAVRGCLPVMGTLLVTFEDQPD